MNDSIVTRKGKIARLPADVRRQLNIRLQDGEKGPVILEWLNGLAIVKKICASDYEGHPVDASNLSEWRRGGYQDFLLDQEKIEATRTLSAFAMDMARAGGGLSEGAAAIAAGKLLQLIETADEDKAAKLASAIALIRAGDTQAIRAKLEQVKLEQGERALVLQEQRFQRETAKLFLQWYDDRRATEIAESKAPKEQRMEKLVQLMFGARPQATK